MSDILVKIQDAGLIGRGGADFPTYIKWQAVKKAKGDPQAGSGQGKKYVVCNASEGELGLFKDLYILKKFPEEVFEGLKIAMDFLGFKECYFNFNKKYWQKTKWKIKPLIRRYESAGYKFYIFKEEPSYIGGEETALLNAIEGKRTEPRFKPPFPTSYGLFGCPTLVHNVETLFNISLVAQNKFKDKRFYCISGQVKNKGVFFLPANLRIKEILEDTGNLPKFDFFVQVGGGISGAIYNKNQIKKQRVEGPGSIEVYKASTNPKNMLFEWFEFYARESCGKCGPCRLGNYNIYEILKKNKKIKWKEIINLLESTEKTSFCPLGKMSFKPVETYVKNVLKLKVPLRRI